MPLFKEPKFDAARERDYAEVRLTVRGRPNIGMAPYLIPLLGALMAILIAAYAVTRPSVKERLLERPRATPPLLEVDLE